MWSLGRSEAMAVDDGCMCEIAREVTVAVRDIALRAEEPTRDSNEDLLVCVMDVDDDDDDDIDDDNVIVLSR